VVISGQSMTDRADALLLKLPPEYKRENRDKIFIFELDCRIKILRWGINNKAVKKISGCHQPYIEKIIL
jgi:hypothetical protein